MSLKHGLGFPYAKPFTAFQNNSLLAIILLLYAVPYKRCLLSETPALQTFDAE